jgi:acyl transferase domain-containing protein/acyl carrier protein
VNDVDEPIAIIGMAGRFPGARDVDQFWLNLCEGRESVHFASDEELLAAGVPAEALRDPAYVKAVAVAPDIDRFDADFFGLTPREADFCDPQIKLFLETAHAAMENAGYDPFQVTDVGVFGSAGVNRYVDMHVRAGNDTVRSASGMSLGVLSNSDYVATLVSYKYNFRGPSMTVQTACSSSMVAVHLAGQALRNGDCDLAIAGGADVEFPFAHGHWWAPGSPLTRDGHCRPFDAGATGTIFGSGVGAVVLKRLADAIADGDHVRAVVRAIAVNNDGSEKVGFSAPGVTGQAAVVAEAMMVSGVDPAEVSYVEAHSTGTVLGDPIEVAALNQAFRRAAAGDLEPGGCHLGSVKGNVGHLGHAAGVASLIKVVLSLENERIPPSINYERPNPKLELDGSPFAVIDRLRPWPRTPGRPRIAGMNSLGIGGTNVHALIEEAPVAVHSPHDGRPRIVVWSGRTAEAERGYREKLSQYFGWHGDEVFADATATLRRGRTPHKVRSALVATGSADVAAALADGGSAAVLSADGTEPGEPVLLFPGQGSQHLGMAEDLYATEPVFARVLDECLGLFDAQGLRVRDAWRSARGDEDLEATETAQPLLFAVGYAMARTWASWGIEPTAVLGHSIGELTAATVAGVFDLPDAIALVAARARAMRTAPEGGMLAVTCDLETVQPLLIDGVVVAVANGPNQTVLAGAPDALAAMQPVLSEHGLVSRRVRTSHAFHSPAMAAAAEQFRAAFDGVRARAPRVPVFSAATGRPMTADEATSPAFWADQLVRPVLFGAALEALCAGPKRLLIEVGPGRALTSLAKQHPAVAGSRHVVIATMPRTKVDGRAERAGVLGAVARVWVDGHEIDWAAVDQEAPLRRLPLPGYPYQRERHWIDIAPAEPVAEREPTERGTPVPAAVAQPEPESPFSTLVWAELPAVRAPRVDAEPTTAVVLLPRDHERALDLIPVLQQADLRVVAVRTADAYRESAAGFEVRDGDPDDLARLLGTLAERGTPAGLLVHALTLGEWEPPTSETVAGQLDDSFHSLLTLVQQGARAGGGHLPALLVLTERSVDVSGSEPVDPAKATLHGLVRTLAEEQPATTAKLIDTAVTVAEDDLVDEIRDWQRSEVVALRGDRRWARVERSYTPAPSDRPVLRKGGVYLITGGLGGLGLAVARELAGTGLRPRLLLLGRTAAEDSAVATELEMLGARVHVLACDVTDRRALRRALDIAAAKFGPVNGVLHLAGVAGDGMLQFRTREQAERVLAPKVQGTVVLHEVFADRPPLDFFVSFSSRAAVGGLVGGGDYAAANAFLDAFARTTGTTETRTLSVNWPAWSSVGMAAAGLAAQVSGDDRTWERVLSAENCPALDEHRIEGTPVLPGTGHLDLVVTAFRDRVLDGVAAPVRLDNVMFQRPLAVRDERRVRVVFRPDGRWWRFSVESEPTTAAGDGPQTHAVGRIAAAEPGTEPRRVDVPALLGTLSERREPPAREATRRFFALGPRWDNVESIHSRPGDRSEQVVSLALPAEFAAEATTYALHPTLLDSATSYARDPEREDPHLPFMYRAMVVHGPLPARLSSHIRRLDAANDMIVADVDLIGPDGRVLVEVTGFTMRRVKDELPEFAATLDRSAAEEPVPAVGIAPRTGGRLLRTLLSSRTPRQVAVLPFRDGRPSAGGLLDAGPKIAPPAPVVAPKPAPVPAAPVVTPTVPAGGDGESVEARLRALWTESLGISAIAVDDDFFELGGNSLTAVELMSRIQAAFQVELSIAALFDFPTLSALADELRRLGAR